MEKVLEDIAEVNTHNAETSVHIVVTGRVQGVAFRAYTQRVARSLELVGWVRNLPDGSVEMEARGSEAAIAEFERKVHQGPANSRVRSLYLTKLKHRLPGEGFEVLR